MSLHFPSRIEIVVEGKGEHFMKSGKWLHGAVLLALTITLAGCTNAKPAVTTEEAAASSAPADVLPAEEDFTQFSALTVGSDGYLHLPDNTTAEDLDTRKISVRNVRFEIPGSWQPHAVARTTYIDDTGADPESNTYGFHHDTEIVSFYEKTAFISSYHSGTLTSENAENGRLCSLYIVNTKKNDLSQIASDLKVVFLGQVKNAESAYDIFLTSPDLPSDTSSAAYEDTYKQMTEAVDYMGAIISTMKFDQGMTFTYANSYIKNHYVDDVDIKGPGMAKGSSLPDLTTESAKAQGDQLPAGVTDGSGTSPNVVSYPWTAWVSPFAYTDGTSAPTPTPTPLLTVTPTLTETPTPTETPTEVPTDIPTGAPTGEPTAAPSESPTEAPLPEPTESPSPDNPDTGGNDEVRTGGEE